MRAGGIDAGFRGGPGGAPGSTRSSSDTDLQPAQSIQIALHSSYATDASRSFALICLNMIFFYPTASAISFSFPR